MTEETVQSSDTARGDTAKARTLLSTQGAQSFVNYQDVAGASVMRTPIRMY
jgi:hypothetical protein